MISVIVGVGRWVFFFFLDASVDLIAQWERDGG